MMNPKLTLLLVIACSFILTKSVYYGSWTQNYESKSAAEKFNYLMGKIMKSKGTESSWPSVFKLGKLAAPKSLGGLDFWVTGGHIADQIPEGRFKGIHSVGKVASCKFNWDKETVKRLGLTGMFRESTEHCIARASSAADPTRKKIPNMAIKVLRDGVPSGNFMLGHGLAGTQDPNFFVNPLANHVPNRHGSFSLDGAEASFVNLVFTKGPEMHGIVGLSDFGRFKHNGQEEPKIKVPFTIVFEPFPETKKKCEGVDLENKNYGCLGGLKKGTTLFNMYVVMEPILAKNLQQKDVHPIGTFETTSEFVSSEFADEQLWFKHLFWDEEVKILDAKYPEAAKKWRSMVNEKFMDTEGPEAYRKFLTSNRSKSVKRRLGKNLKPKVKF